MTIIIATHIQNIINETDIDIFMGILIRDEKSSW